MEKTLQSDGGAWSSTQEIRSKLLKHKTTLQEVISHKRIIEAVAEKAQAVVLLTSQQGGRASIGIVQFHNDILNEV